MAEAMPFPNRCRSPNREARQTRDLCALRAFHAARPDPSLSKKR